MLESLSIRNFQAHSKFKLEFDPRVTTICGPSDRGKSAIIRAIRWLATNKPSGEAFIKDGEETAKVTLVLDGGRTIRRARGGENIYKIDGEPLKAFGQDVPEPVAKLLNLAEVNFQGQHDAPYWFALTGGEVSRQINEIIDLGLIDKTLSGLASAGREAAGRVSAAESRIALIKEERRRLAPARIASRDLKLVEGLESAAMRTVLRADGLRQGLEEASWYAEAHKNAAAFAASAQETARLGDAWAGKAGEVGRLEAMLQNLATLQDQAGRKIPDLGPLERIAESLISAKRQQAVLGEVVFEAGILHDRAEAARENATAAASAFDSAVGKVCPICGKARG